MTAEMSDDDVDAEIAAVRARRRMIDEVYERSGAGRVAARAALDLRGNCVDCAVEYLLRTGLAAVMPDTTRYPHWAVCRHR